MLDKIFPIQNDDEDDNSLVMLPALLGLSLIVPALAFVGYSFLSRRRRKKAPSATPETAPVQEESPLPVVELPQEFRVLHGLSHLDFSPAVEGTGQVSVWVRRYNLAKNGVYQVAAVILAEITGSEAHTSDHWQGAPGEEDELEIILDRYNVTLYRPGRWMHQDQMALEAERERLGQKLHAAVNEFTKNTGIPVRWLKPHFLWIRDQGLAIEFDLGVDVITGDERGRDGQPVDDRPLPCGLWSYCSSMGPGYNDQIPEMHDQFIEGLMRYAIREITGYILTTGQTVSAVEFFPTWSSEAIDMVGFEYEEGEVALHLGNTLEEVIEEEAEVEPVAEDADAPAHPANVLPVLTPIQAMPLSLPAGPDETDQAAVPPAITLTPETPALPQMVSLRKIA